MQFNRCVFYPILAFPSFLPLSFSFSSSFLSVPNCTDSLRDTLKKVVSVTGTGKYTCPVCRLSALTEVKRPLRHGGAVNWASVITSTAVVFSCFQDEMWVHYPLYHINLSNESPIKATAPTSTQPTQTTPRPHSSVLVCLYGCWLCGLRRNRLQDCPICKKSVSRPMQVHIHNRHGPPGRG